MKKNKLIIILAWTLVHLIVCAQSTVTMAAAIQSAIRNRKNIQSGKIDIAIQQLKTKALFNKYGPQVSAEYNYNYNPILQSSIIPVGKFNPTLPSDATERVQFGTTWTQSAGITASQPLFDATIKKQINESKWQEKISMASQAQTEYELAYEVSKAYINIGLQLEQINAAIIDTTRTWISYQLQLGNFTAGRLLKSELNTAIINHNNTKQLLKDASMLLVENKIYLMYVTGELESQSGDFNIDTSFFKNKNLLWSDSKANIDSIPIFQQLIYQKQLSHFQKQTENSKYLPVASLQAFLGANQFSNNFNPIEANKWFGYSYIGFNLKIPLINGDDKKNKLEQLQLQSQIYDKQMEDKSSQYSQESITATIEMTRIKLLLATQEENIKLYRETLQILQDRFRGQQITASELNSQENELQKLLANYHNTKIKAWLYGLSYFHATGLLSKLWK